MSGTIEFPKASALNTYAWLPITMQQFEDLTNEMLTHINELSKPLALDADYVAQVLMSAIHAYDHKNGKVRKSELLESCINRISCHVTYHAVQEIQKRIKAKCEASGESVETVSAVPPQSEEVLPDEVTGGPV